VAEEAVGASVARDDPRWSPPLPPRARGGDVAGERERSVWSDARWGLPRRPTGASCTTRSYAGDYTQSVLWSQARHMVVGGDIHLRPPCAPAELTVERLCTGREYLHMQCNLESLEQRWELVRQAMRAARSEAPD